MKKEIAEGGGEMGGTQQKSRERRKQVIKQGRKGRLRGKERGGWNEQKRRGEMDGSSCQRAHRQTGLFSLK